LPGRTDGSSSRDRIARPLLESDSGRPVFEEGTNVNAGVVSFGFNPQCKGQDYSYRLDRQEVLDWINDPNREDAG
jgi:hypothetical protein